MSSWDAGARQVGAGAAEAADGERTATARRFTVIEANPADTGRVPDATGIDAAGDGGGHGVGVHGLGGVGRSARRLAVKLIGAA